MKAESRILFVDDDPVNRTITVRLFKRLGILIDTADNGQEAIRKLEENDYDLILMDVSMPGMDGLEASQYIRHKMKSPKKEVRIIATTGYDSDSDKKRCMLAGMNDYISKPFDLVALFQKLGIMARLPKFLAWPGVST